MANQKKTPKKGKRVASRATVQKTETDLVFWLTILFTVLSIVFTSVAFWRYG